MAAKSRAKDMKKSSYVRRLSRRQGDRFNGRPLRQPDAGMGALWDQRMKDFLIKLYKYTLIALGFSLIAVPELILSEVWIGSFKEGVQPPSTEATCHDPPIGAEPKQAKPHDFGLCMGWLQIKLKPLNFGFLGKRTLTEVK